MNGLTVFADSTWGKKYPATVQAWETTWDRFMAFLDFVLATRKVIYTTNAIESLNYQLRKITQEPRALPQRRRRGEAALTGDHEHRGQTSPRMHQTSQPTLSRLLPQPGLQMRPAPASGSTRRPRPPTAPRPGPTRHKSGLTGLQKLGLPPSDRLLTDFLPTCCLRDGHLTSQHIQHDPPPGTQGRPPHAQTLLQDLHNTPATYSTHDMMPTWSTPH